MKILGLDPGLERVGYGLILREGSRVACLDHGLITTPRIELPDRLAYLRVELKTLIDRLEPDALATEKLLFSVNRKTALDVAKALGVILLCVGETGRPWAEYAPSEVKQAVVGTGAADKKQVEFMVVKLLSLPAPPKPDDVADALAIALCHAFRSRVAIR